MKHPNTIRYLSITLLFVLFAILTLRTERGSAAAQYILGKLRGRSTLEQRVHMHSADVEVRLKPRFESAGLTYPPSQLAYVAFKQSARLQVYAGAHASEKWHLVQTYPILGLSGHIGPKLRRGDNQVPEGLYQAQFLNPNSRFHLSIRLNYPNNFDQAQAVADGRTDLGSDIMIHGTSASIGCLAMGNQAAEDLFVLAALAGKENVEIIVTPTDLRRSDVKIPPGSPNWLPLLYDQIKTSLARFPISSSDL